MIVLAMSQTPVLDKKQILERLLDAGMVLVALDARSEGVDVPAQYRGDMQLRLNLSHRFELPMQLTEVGITASLTFDGAPFDCCLPWDAIFLMVSHTTGQPVLFRDQVPIELASAHLPGLPDPDLEPEPQRPALRLVATDDSGEVGEPGSDPSDASADDHVAAMLPVLEPATKPVPAASATGDDLDEPLPPPPSGVKRGHLRVVK